VAAAVVAALVAGVLVGAQPKSADQGQAAAGPASGEEGLAVRGLSGDERREPSAPAAPAPKPAPAKRPVAAEPAGKPAAPAAKKPAATADPVAASSAAPRPAPAADPPAGKGQSAAGDLSFVASIRGRRGQVCTAAVVDPVVLLAPKRCLRDGLAGLSARVGATGAEVGLVGPPVAVAGSEVALLRLAAPVAVAPVGIAAEVPLEETPLTAVSAADSPSARPRQAAGVVAADQDCAKSLGSAAGGPARAGVLCVRLSGPGSGSPIDLGGLALVQSAGGVRLAGAAVTAGGDGDLRPFADLAAHRRQLEREVRELAASR
jgi:hypothetical protein